MTFVTGSPSREYSLNANFPKTAVRGKDAVANTPHLGGAVRSLRSFYAKSRQLQIGNHVKIRTKGRLSAVPLKIVRWERTAGWARLEDFRRLRQTRLRQRSPARERGRWLAYRFPGADIRTFPAGWRQMTWLRSRLPALAGLSPGSARAWPH